MPTWLLIKNDQQAVTIAVTAASLTSWLLLAASTQGLVIPGVCTAASATVPFVGASWDLLLALNPAPPWLAGWMVMVAAMMLPTLYHALLHVRCRVLRRTRAAALGMFLLGYALIWAAGGLATWGLTLVAALWLPPGWPGFAAALLIALIWQASPAKQFALNRCHLFPPLAAGGGTMLRDTLVYGLTRGGWCFASCWALMLVPMFAGTWHWPVMLAVALWLYGEQLERPVAPAWGWRMPNVLGLIIRNRLQTHIRPYMRGVTEPVLAECKERGGSHAKS